MCRPSWICIKPVKNCKGRQLTTNIATIPQVTLTKAFSSPFKNVIAAARTCYSSKGIIDDEQISLEEDSRDRAIAASIYRAGHHTTFQHAQFQFTLSEISRHFVWSFLHSHPFYNSEQVSQRYVRLDKDSFYIPPITGAGLELYRKTIDRQMAVYHELREALFPAAEAEYFRIFPARSKRREHYKRDIQRKTQEAVRYVAPVATLTYLYHTISAVTLLRYWRSCRQTDASHEQRQVVELMVRAVLAHDPGYELVLEEPLEEADFAEFPWIQDTARPGPGFKEEFDASLEGRVSRLVDYKTGGEETLAMAVREVLGRSRSELPDDDAIALALDPDRNPVFGEVLNLTTHAKLTRTLHHPGYTFRKYLSHTADSQDQRHRMTPASRPILAAQLSDEPDFITPALIQADESSLQRYREIMDRTWEAIEKLKKLGLLPEFAHYLLPNAVAVRFTESADLLNLHHKHRMRLCYNSQEEIWRASVDEAEQVRQVHSRIGRYLLPPCTLRRIAGAKPYCPEGDRYCGVPVWNLDIGEYERLL
ncbi:MAG: FAD-dependent thymidylate synthase [Fidelibacterota bacterium]|nr:MAG: FAD-dependent thymidylate synthase [Candidatus Neomarinimicrobiota bacterium]